jgi:hypothetical protein
LALRLEARGTFPAKRNAAAWTIFEASAIAIVFTVPTAVAAIAEAVIALSPWSWMSKTLNPTIN